MRRVLRIFLTLLLLGTFLVACQRQETADSAKRVTEHPVGKPPADELPPVPGAVCSIDADCERYLRCDARICKTPPALDGTGDPSTTPAVSIMNSTGESQFFVEVVDTVEERTRGLMFRPRMDPDWGMLFLYPAERQRSFWMKNTLIPLDMVFITDDMRVLGVVKNAEPKTLSSRKVPGKSRYILELVAGSAEKFGVGAGDRVFFGRIPRQVLDASEP